MFIWLQTKSVHLSINVNVLYITNTHRQGCPFSINTLNFIKTFQQKSRIANIFYHITMSIFFFLCFFNFPIGELRRGNTWFYLPYRRNIVSIMVKVSILQLKNWVKYLKVFSLINLLFIVQFIIAFLKNERRIVFAPDSCLSVLLLNVN